MNFIAGLLLAALPAAGKDTPIFTSDFPASEFAARRARVLEAIAPDVVLLQGAASPLGYVRFRQPNSFCYLTGVEAPHACLLRDGREGRSVLYLPPRDERRESSEGRLLSASDRELAMERTGVDDARPAWMLADDLARPDPAVVHAPLASAELAGMSRDLATRGTADIAKDPWDGRESREAVFANHPRERGIEVRDLSPVLDSMRLVKSEREVRLIRKATELSGRALMEAMRSTRPGVREHELDAIGKFVFFRSGAQADARRSLVATGTNAWRPHRHRGASELREGELVLMDYGSDVGYYTSDVTRMRPVDGTFRGWRRDLYGFHLTCCRAILDAIRPGDVAAVMAALPNRAAEAFVASCRARAESRPSGMGHGVGMAAHDLGSGDGALVPGMVFTIEPQFRVPEERICIRLEDVPLITDDGVENLSGFVPLDMDAIEELMREPGMLDRYPRELPARPNVR